MRDQAPKQYREQLGQIDPHQTFLRVQIDLHVPNTFCVTAPPHTRVRCVLCVALFCTVCQTE